MNDTINDYQDEEHSENHLWITHAISVSGKTYSLALFALIAFLVVSTTMKSAFALEPQARPAGIGINVDTTFLMEKEKLSQAMKENPYCKMYFNYRKQTLNRYVSPCDYIPNKGAISPLMAFHKCSEALVPLAFEIDRKDRVRRENAGQACVGGLYMGGQEAFNSSLECLGTNTNKPAYCRFCLNLKQVNAYSANPGVLSNQHLFATFLAHEDIIDNGMRPQSFQEALALAVDSSAQELIKDYGKKMTSAIDQDLKMKTAKLTQLRAQVEKDIKTLPRDITQTFTEKSKEILCDHLSHWITKISTDTVSMSMSEKNFNTIKTLISVGVCNFSTLASHTQEVIQGLNALKGTNSPWGKTLAKMLSNDLSYLLSGETANLSATSKIISTFAKEFLPSIEAIAVSGSNRMVLAKIIPMVSFVLTMNDFIVSDQRHTQDLSGCPEIAQHLITFMTAEGEEDILKLCNPKLSPTFAMHLKEVAKNITTGQNTCYWQGFLNPMQNSVNFPKAYINAKIITPAYKKFYEKNSQRLKI